MTERTVLRAYDRREKSTLEGLCFFFVLPGTWDDLDDYDWSLFLNQTAMLRWNNFTSYAFGTVALEESEMYHCEIMPHWQEVRIDVSRVQNLEKRKLPYPYDMEELGKEHGRQY